MLSTGSGSMIAPLAVLDALERALKTPSPEPRLALARLRQGVAQQAGRLTELERERSGLLSLIRRGAILAEPRGTEQLAPEMLDLPIAQCRADGQVKELAQKINGMTRYEVCSVIDSGA